MKKYILLSILLLTSVCIADYAETNTWLVSKTGNNSNPGTPDADPVDLTTRAFLTIGAATAAASAGDVIIVWPGTYSEVVTLTDSSLISATGKKDVVISGSASIQLSLNGHCAISGIKVVSSGAIGITAMNGGDYTIVNCDGYGTTDGLYASGNGRLIIRDSNFSSPWDGANMGGWKYALVEGTTFLQIGSTGQNAHACQLPAAGIFRNCNFLMSDTSTTSNPLQAVEFGSGGSGLVNAILESCRIINNAPAGRTGTVSGVTMSDAGSTALLVNCLIITSGAGASGGPKDIVQTAGTIEVFNTLYSRTKTSGTIIDRNYAIQQKTDNLPANPASATDVSFADANIIAAIAATDANIIAEVADIDTNSVTLAAGGLDNISTAEPNGVADTWPEMTVQLWRRFFKRVVRDADNDDPNYGYIYTYNDADEIATTQSYGLDVNDLSQQYVGSAE